ncbi:MAG: histidine triad nucleotide-binding protein [Acidimicrobiales bacterium]
MEPSTLAVPDCLFCRIVAGDLASEQVLSGEHTLAFRDINPAAPTHVLVIPRAHVTDAQSIEASHGDLLVEMFATAQRVAEIDGLERGYRLVFNVGEDSGNSVAHLHLHVLGGRTLSWPPG